MSKTSKTSAARIATPATARKGGKGKQAERQAPLPLAEQLFALDAAYQAERAAASSEPATPPPVESAPAPSEPAPVESLPVEQPAPVEAAATEQPSEPSTPAPSAPPPAAIATPIGSKRGRTAGDIGARKVFALLDAGVPLHEIRAAVESGDTDALEAKIAPPSQSISLGMRGKPRANQAELVAFLASKGITLAAIIALSDKEKRELLDDAEIDMAREKRAPRWALLAK